MSIVITPGEKTLIEVCQDRGIKIEIENLLVGDIHIRKNDSTVYIFERKSKGDLEASIKDGRYREQKSRLIETGLPRKNIIYILEQLNKPQGSAHKRLWSAICNTQHRDGFSVFQTKSITDTIDYVVGMASSVSKFNGINDCVISNNVNVNIKKRQVKQDEWFKYSLTLIPQVSIDIAEIITMKYPNMNSLLTVAEDTGLDCLANLKHGEKHRRIGKKLSEKICETLLLNL
jgi:crossover junction endonuclease MUS81